MNIQDRLWVRHPVFFTTWVNSYPMLLWDFCLLPYSWIVLSFLTSNLKSPCFTVYIVNCIKYNTIIYPNDSNYRCLYCKLCQRNNNIFKMTLFITVYFQEIAFFSYNKFHSLFSSFKFNKGKRGKLNFFSAC